MKKDDPIFEIARKRSSIQRDLAAATLVAYGLEVDEIVRNKIQDKQRIECILDRLLDAAFDEEILQYYKRLCRHLYFIDEQAAVFYVQSYREMWDEESMK